MDGLDDKHRAINPYSIFRRIWEYVMFFFSALVLFELPFEWIYEIPLIYQWIIPSLIMDVFFAIDIFISQNTGILEYGVVSLNKKYIHSKMTVLRKIVYWITPIPFYLIGYFVKSEKVYRILITFKVLRIVRLGEAIHTMQTSLIYVGPFSKMLILLVFLFFIDHIFACIFWLVGDKELPGPSWLHEVAFIDNEPQMIQYIHTLYYITTTMLTIGYGDLHPYTFNEIIVIIAVECIGVFFYNFFLSNMVSIVADPSRTSFLEKYQKIYIAFKWRGVSNDSILELLRYFEYVWERNHDESDFYENAQRMPDSLKKKVALALHAQLFEKIDSIKDLSQESRGQIAMRLRPRIFTPGDYLIKAGSLSKKIFFLSSGKVQVLSSCGSLINSHEGPAGIIFGIGSFLNGSEEVTCVIAQTYVETYELTKSDFDDLKDLNEDFRNSMRTRKGLGAPIKSRFNLANNNPIASPRIAHIQNLSGIPNIPPLGEIPLLHSNATALNMINDKHRRATTALAPTSIIPNAEPNSASQSPRTPPSQETTIPPPPEEEIIEPNEEKPKIRASASATKLPINASSLATMTTLNNRNSVKANPQLSLNQAEYTPAIQSLSNSTLKIQNQSRKSIRISDVMDGPQKTPTPNVVPISKTSSLNLSAMPRSNSKISFYESPNPKLPPFPAPKPRAKEMPIRHVPSLSPRAWHSIELQKQENKLNPPFLPPLPPLASEVPAEDPSLLSQLSQTDGTKEDDKETSTPTENNEVAPAPETISPSPSKPKPPIPTFGPSRIPPSIPRADLPATHVPQQQELPPLIPDLGPEAPKTSDVHKETTQDLLEMPKTPQPSQFQQFQPQQQLQPSQFQQLQQLQYHQQPHLSQFPAFNVQGSAIVPKQKRIMITDMLKPQTKPDENPPKSVSQASILPKEEKEKKKKHKKKNKHKHKYDDDDDDESQSLESDVDDDDDDGHFSHPPV